MSANRSSRKNKTFRVTPPAAWLVAALYGIVFVASFRCAAHHLELPRMQAFWNFNQNRIDRYAEIISHNPEDVAIVMLGNCKTRYGTNVDDKTMRVPEHDHVRVLRVVNDRANFSDFQPLTESILDIHPDLIVIQADMLGRKRLLNRVSKPHLLHDFLEWSLAGNGDWNPERIDQLKVQTDQADWNDQSAARFKRRQIALTKWQTMSMNGEEARLAIRFIHRALARRIPVVLHYPPISERVERFQKDLIKDQTLTVERLAKHEGVTLLDFPDKMPLSSFSDFIHMNQKGRSEFMPWLMSELLCVARQTPCDDHNARYLNSAGGEKLQK